MNCSGVYDAGFYWNRRKPAVIDAATAGYSAHTCQPRQNLGIEIRRFLGHDVAFIGMSRI